MKRFSNSPGRFYTGLKPGVNETRLLRQSPIILEVAQPIGSHLEMDVAGLVNEALTPIVYFDAIAIVILEGETVTVHWSHVEGVSLGCHDT